MIFIKLKAKLSDFDGPHVIMNVFCFQQPNRQGLGKPRRKLRGEIVEYRSQMETEFQSVDTESRQHTRVR